MRKAAAILRGNWFSWIKNAARMAEATSELCQDDDENSTTVFGQGAMMPREMYAAHPCPPPPLTIVLLLLFSPYLRVPDQ